MWRHGCFAIKEVRWQAKARNTASIRCVSRARRGWTSGHESYAKEERCITKKKERNKKEKREERAKRKNKRQSGSRGHKRRGTRANQIALICCASSKNVNARRPLVIQSCRGLLSFFPSIHARFFFSLRFTISRCLVSFTRYTRWLLSAVLCSALRFSYADLSRPEFTEGRTRKAFRQGVAEQVESFVHSACKCH